MMLTSNTSPNGSAMAAFVGGAIGAFAMGFVVILNETGIFAAPTLYGPAGGVTGRTTLAVVLWLIAWGVLHARWRGRDVNASRALLAATILTLAGVALLLPPVWGLL